MWSIWDTIFNHLPPHASNFQCVFNITLNHNGIPQQNGHHPISIRKSPHQLKSVFMRMVIVSKDWRRQQSQSQATAALKCNICYPQLEWKRIFYLRSCALLIRQFTSPFALKTIHPTCVQRLSIIYAIQPTTICIEFALILTLSCFVWTTTVWPQCPPTRTIPRILSSG